MIYQIKELLLPDGKSPYANWFGALDATVAAKVSVAAARMEQGNLSNVSGYSVLANTKSTGVQAIASIWQKTG